MDKSEVFTLKQLGNLSRSMCLQSAEAIIDLVSAILESGCSQREYFGAWWFTIYYSSSLFLSGLILLLTYFNSF